MLLALLPLLTSCLVQSSDAHVVRRQAADQGHALQVDVTAPSTNHAGMPQLFAWQPYCDNTYISSNKQVEMRLYPASARMTLAKVDLVSTPSAPAGQGGDLSGQVQAAEVGGCWPALKMEVYPAEDYKAVVWYKASVADPDNGVSQFAFNQTSKQISVENGAGFSVCNQEFQDGNPNYSLFYNLTADSHLRSSYQCWDAQLSLWSPDTPGDTASPL